MKPIKNQHGVALIGVLVAISVLGLMSGIAASSWKTIMQREREEELLWRGNQYRKAIESYFNVEHAGSKGALPPNLDSLVKDPRSLSPLRHIRKLYKDPITGDDWVLVKDPTGKIIGVRSSSMDEPFKKSGFSKEDEKFEEKESYSEWQFVFEADKAKKKQQTGSEETGTEAAVPAVPGSSTGTGTGTGTEQSGQ